MNPQILNALKSSINFSAQSCILDKLKELGHGALFLKINEHGDTFIHSLSQADPAIVPLFLNLGKLNSLLQQVGKPKISKFVFKTIVFKQNGSGKNLLELAVKDICCGNNKQIVETYIDMVKDKIINPSFYINGLPGQKTTLLHEVIKNNQIDLVARLTSALDKNHPCMLVADWKGQTPVETAVEIGSMSIVSAIVKITEPPNAKLTTFLQRRSRVSSSPAYLAFLEYRVVACNHLPAADFQDDFEFYNFVVDNFASFWMSVCAQFPPELLFDSNLYKHQNKMFHIQNVFDNFARINKTVVIVLNRFQCWWQELQWIIDVSPANVRFAVLSNMESVYTGPFYVKDIFVPGDETEFVEPESIYRFKEAYNEFFLKGNKSEKNLLELARGFENLAFDAQEAYKIYSILNTKPKNQLKMGIECGATIDGDFLVNIAPKIQNSEYQLLLAKALKNNNQKLDVLEKICKTSADIYLLVELAWAHFDTAGRIPAKLMSQLGDTWRSLTCPRKVAFGGYQIGLLYLKNDDPALAQTFFSNCALQTHMLTKIDLARLSFAQSKALAKLGNLEDAVKFARISLALFELAYKMECAQIAKVLEHIGELENNLFPTEQAFQVYKTCDCEKDVERVAKKLTAKFSTLNKFDKFLLYKQFIKSS